MNNVAIEFTHDGEVSRFEDEQLDGADLCTLQDIVACMVAFTFNNPAAIIPPPPLGVAIVETIKAMDKAK